MSVYSPLDRRTDGRTDERVIVIVCLHRRRRRLLRSHVCVYDTCVSHTRVESSRSGLLRSSVFRRSSAKSISNFITQTPLQANCCLVVRSVDSSVVSCRKVREVRRGKTVVNVVVWSCVATALTVSLEDEESARADGQEEQEE